MTEQAEDRPEPYGQKIGDGGEGLQDRAGRDGTEGMAGRGRGGARRDQETPSMLISLTFIYVFFQSVGYRGFHAGGLTGRGIMARGAVRLVGGRSAV